MRGVKVDGELVRISFASLTIDNKNKYKTLFPLTNAYDTYGKYN